MSVVRKESQLIVAIIVVIGDLVTYKPRVIHSLLDLNLHIDQVFIVLMLSQVLVGRSEFRIMTIEPRLEHIKNLAPRT